LTVDHTTKLSHRAMQGLLSSVRSRQVSRSAGYRKALHHLGVCLHPSPKFAIHRRALLRETDQHNDPDALIQHSGVQKSDPRVDRALRPQPIEAASRQISVLLRTTNVPEPAD
jgi:hypothetical protein